MNTSNSLINYFINNSVGSSEPENVGELIDDLVSGVMNKVESALLFDLVSWEISNINQYGIACKY